MKLSDFKVGVEYQYPSLKKGKCILVHTHGVLIESDTGCCWYADGSSYFDLVKEVKPKVKVWIAIYNKNGLIFHSSHCTEASRDKYIRERVKYGSTVLEVIEREYEV